MPNCVLTVVPTVASRAALAPSPGRLTVEAASSSGCACKDASTAISEASEPVKNVPTTPEERGVYILGDDDILQLARWACIIEDHYGRPMDIEWALDKDLPAGGNIFILQARPETVWSEKPVTSAVETTRSATDFILAGLLSGRKIS